MSWSSEESCASMSMQVKGLSLRPRMSHSATGFTISQEITEVVIFGGETDFFSNSEISHTMVLRFGEGMCVT